MKDNFMKTSLSAGPLKNMQANSALPNRPAMTTSMTSSGVGQNGRAMTQQFKPSPVDFNRISNSNGSLSAAAVANRNRIKKETNL